MCSILRQFDPMDRVEIFRKSKICRSVGGSHHGQLVRRVGALPTKFSRSASSSDSSSNR